MRQHYKSRNPLLQRKRLMEPFSTDTWFSTVTSYEGYNCAQIFVGNNSKYVKHYGMRSEGSGPDALLEFFRDAGVPISITRDNSKMQTSNLWNEYMKRYWVKDKFTEPYHSGQNPAERAMSVQKEKLERIMIESGCTPEAWFRAACHVADVNNHTANKTLNFRTPAEVHSGETPDISGLVQYQFWDPVYYVGHTEKFPTTGGSERLGRWVGRAHDFGEKMCYWILDEETKQLVVRSLVRSAKNTKHPNKALDEQLANAEKQDQSFPIITYLNSVWEEDEKLETPKSIPEKQDFPKAPKVK